MKGISLNTLAHPRPDRARLHPSRRRVLAAPGLRDGCKPAQLSRPAWLRPPIRSVLAPPRHPAPGGNESAVLLFRQHGDHILYQSPAIATGFHYQANVIARRQLFGSQMGGMSGQVMDKEPMLFLSRIRPNTMDSACRFGTRFSHSTPRQRSPRIRRWAFPWRSHPAEIRFALAGSTRTAYQGETPVLTVAFIMAEAFQHPAHPDLTDQARISDVIQDSDFRTEIASRKKPCFSAVPPCVRRTPGDFATPHHFHLRQPNT